MQRDRARQVVDLWPGQAPAEEAGRVDAARNNSEKCLTAKLPALYLGASTEGRCYREGLEVAYAPERKGYAINKQTIYQARLGFTGSVSGLGDSLVHHVRRAARHIDDRPDQPQHSEDWRDVQADGWRREVLYQLNAYLRGSRR
jgi:hypothetical protein